MVLSRFTLHTVYKQKQIIQTFLFISFKMQFSEEKKAPLDRVGRKVKKIFFSFFRVGPKNRVGRDMGNR